MAGCGHPRARRIVVVSLLESILATKRREVEALMASNSAASPRPTPRAPLDAVSALRRAVGASLRLIAEIKRKSPSAGPLSTVLGPSERALVYAEAGATMVSVLCDGPFFDGSWEHLALARRGLDVFRARVPLLAKEYVIDERQIVLARDHGGDAVLLIARIVTPARLAELARAARGEGIEPLLEVVDERELDAALAAGARIIGVNARDLDTLQSTPPAQRAFLG